MTHKALRKNLAHNARLARDVADGERRDSHLNAATGGVIYCYMRELLLDINLFRTADFDDHYLEFLAMRFKALLGEANKRGLRVDDQAAEQAAEICYKYTTACLLTKYFTDTDYQADVDNVFFGGRHLGGLLGTYETVVKNQCERVAEKLRGGFIENEKPLC